MYCIQHVDVRCIISSNLFAGDDVIHRAPPAYSDMTYKPSGSSRPNPREVSNEIFAGESGLPSYDNKTLMFVYFGKCLFLMTSLISTRDVNKPIFRATCEVGDYRCSGFVLPDRAPEDRHSSGRPTVPVEKTKFSSNKVIVVLVPLYFFYIFQLKLDRRYGLPALSQVWICQAYRTSTQQTEKSCKIF